MKLILCLISLLLFSFSRPSGPSIARSQSYVQSARSYPAHLSAKTPPTRARWKDTSERMPVIESQSYVQSARSYPAHLPAKTPPTRARWKETSERMPVIESQSYVQSARSYPAHLPAKNLPTSARWKETSERMPVTESIDSNDYSEFKVNENHPFLDVYFIDHY